MPSSVPSTPPPPEAPNRRLHYLGLTILVIALVAGMVLLL
jgi:hypothetical protein